MKVECVFRCNHECDRIAKKKMNTIVFPTALDCSHDRLIETFQQTLNYIMKLPFLQRCTSLCRKKNMKLKTHVAIICLSFPFSAGRSFSSSVAPMKLLVVLLIADAVSSIAIGTIENCTYAPVNAPSFIFNATTCDSCLCAALLHHSPSFVALNCFLSGQRCELFFNYSTPFDMLPNPNSTFYCYPNLPPIPTTLGRMCFFLCSYKHHPHSHALISSTSKHCLHTSPPRQRPTRLVQYHVSDLGWGLNLLSETTVSL